MGGAVFGGVEWLVAATMLSEPAEEEGFDDPSIASAGSALEATGSRDSATKPTIDAHAAVTAIQRRTFTAALHPLDRPR